MLNPKRTFFLAIFLCIFIFSGSAYALKFTGDAYVAQHYTDPVSPTDEYFLVIDSSDVGPLKKIRLKGFKVATPSSSPDFTNLTSKTGIDPVTYLQVDTESRYFRKLEKKANKRYNKLMRKGILDPATDRDAWVDEWMGNKLENSLFKLVLKGEDGKTYKSRIGFATFLNPPPGGEGDTAAVPEPATMLLLGTGLLGLAAMRRRFIK